VERVDGPNLAEMRDDQGMWTGSEKVAQAIWMDGLSALEYLRQNSVLHLDIKPGNLVWAVNERIAKLCDFGTASRGNTEKGGGTPYYVPPEFWAGMGRSPASDMYGLGIVMLYVLRYIALPELCCGWDIHEALSSAKSESYREMCNWLDFVEEKRKVIKDPEVSGMIAVIPRDRSEPGELLEYLQPIGLDLSSRFGDSMCVTWEGFLGTRPTDKGSTTIPFTSPMSPTAIPEVASNLVATAVVGKRRRTTRIFKTRARFAEDNTSSTDTSAQLRRSARIARRNNVSELHL
jgi:serine/threonine protein kinase